MFSLLLHTPRKRGTYLSVRYRPIFLCKIRLHKGRNLKFLCKVELRRIHTTKIFNFLAPLIIEKDISEFEKMSVRYLRFSCTVEKKMI